MEEERKAKGKTQYRDPRLAAKREPEVATPALEAREAHVKEPRPKKQKTITTSDRKVRETTKMRTQIQNNELQERQSKPRRKNKKREWRQPTQAEILREAKETERKNTESLNQIRAWEEDEKARRKVKGPVLVGPRMIYHSKGPQTIITFKDCDADDSALPEYFASLRGRTGTALTHSSSRQSLVGAQVANLLLVTSLFFLLFFPPFFSLTALRCGCLEALPRLSSSQTRRQAGTTRKSGC